MNPTIEQAQQALEQGHPDQVISLATILLQEQPDHPAPHRLLGEACYQQHDFSRAQTALEQSLKLDADQTVLYPLLAHCYRQNGLYESAITCYETGLRTNPADVLSWFYLGSCHLKLDHPATTCSLWHKALSLDPENQDIKIRLRTLLLMHRHIQDAIALDAHDLTALLNLCDYLMEQKMWDAAHQAADQALLHHENAQTCSKKGSVYYLQEAYAAALPWFERALSYDPDDIHAYEQCGLLHLEQNMPEAAIPYFQQALQLKPDNPDTLSNLGYAQAILHQYDQAIASFEEALHYDPNHIPTLLNIGSTLDDLARPQEAIPYYDRALIKDPTHHDIRWNRALAHLVLGQYQQGWQDYEARWSTRRWEQYKRTFSQPLWLGNTPIQGKRLLIYAEQGLGDTLQFCRYLPQVAQLGAQLVFEVYPHLHSLLQQLSPFATIVVNGDPLPEFDWQIPLVSLPLALKTTLETIPNQLPYLQAAPDKITEWEKYLAQLILPKGYRIGIAWRGNPKYAKDHLRSMALETLIPLFTLNAQFICLQQDLNDVERSMLNLYPNVYSVHDRLHDFSDTAACIHHLDLVISIDSCIPHLAGALNKPAWIMLPHPSDFRWLLTGNDSPWYPGVVTLFRQTTTGDWSDVIRNIQQNLHARLHIPPRSAEPNMHITQRLQQAFSAHQQNRLEEASMLYQQILAQDPNHFDALHLMGVACFQRGQLSQAYPYLDAALRIAPQHIDALYNKALLLQHDKQYDAALQVVENLLELAPQHAKGWQIKTCCYSKKLELDPAIAAAEKAVEYDPAEAANYTNLGFLFSRKKNHMAAQQCLEHSVSLNINQPGVLSKLALSCLFNCDWEKFNLYQEKLRQQLIENQVYSPPFDLSPLGLSRDLVKTCTEKFVRDYYPRPHPPLPAYPPHPDGKIRLGFYSQDFYLHAVGLLISRLFELFDRNRFELHGFCLAAHPPQDTVRERIVQALDYFHVMGQRNDEEVIALSHQLNIDIAIDMAGYTGDSRYAIFEQRAAPLQVHYLGYPGTLGAPFIDYLIADPVIIPPEHLADYSEKILHLPDSYQINDDQLVAGNTTYTRQSQGLPEQGFVFACFNNNYKVTPDVFTAWMNILHATPGSVLWLLQDQTIFGSRIREQAGILGIDPSRIVFAAYLPLQEHLMRQKLVDVYLDTWHYTGHATSSYVLWSGVPLIARLGVTFPGRVAASLLYACGLPELVTHSTQDYQELAISLARSPAKLQAIKTKLAEKRLNCRLFDSVRFTRNFEQAMHTIWQHQQHGHAPEHVVHAVAHA